MSVNMSLKKWFKKINSNVLYYPGCLTKYVGKELKENYIKILQEIGIDFIQLTDKEVCCGSPIINSGHKQEAKELALKNKQIFKEHSVRKIITNCPACYYMFYKIYPTLVEDWDIEVEHITQTISKAIKENKIKINNLDIDITYHDPCHLGRSCGVYEEPREIVRKLGQLKEMKLNKNYSLCCGGGGGVKSNFLDLSNSVAEERIAMAKETNANCLTTSCPMCYLNLKENSKDLKVKEISQLIVGDKK
jgi:Fe-S oxidoreductase